MKIEEARDGFIKLKTDGKTALSSFILITGADKKYVAQITKVDNNSAIGKLLFLYANGELQKYDNTLPSEEAQITNFTEEIINNSVQNKNPIIIGQVLDNEVLVKLDTSSLKDGLLAIVDDNSSNNKLVKNISIQLKNYDKNTIIIDSLGIINAKKYVASEDFKLPINTQTLKYMYEECLNDATEESKSLIIDIFKNLSEYSKTISFIPFQLLKTIVDDMVNKSHVFSLMVLKRKLDKFAELGYFANTKNEILDFEKLLNIKCVVIDVSKLNSMFLNYFVGYIYNELEGYKEPNVLFEMSNAISKRNIKNAIDSDKINSMIITHSAFSYLNDIKNYFGNFIISQSERTKRIFNVYSSFIQSMPKETFLTIGNGTNYIPIVTKPADSELIKGYIEEKVAILPETQVVKALDNETQYIDDEEPELNSLVPEVATVDNNDENLLIEDTDLEKTDEINDEDIEIDLSEENIETDSDTALNEDEIIESINKVSENVINNIAENISIDKKVIFEDNTQDYSDEPVPEIEDFQDMINDELSQEQEIIEKSTEDTELPEEIDIIKEEDLIQEESETEENAENADLINYDSDVDISEIENTAESDILLTENSDEGLIVEESDELVSNTQYENQAENNILESGADFKTDAENIELDSSSNILEQNDIISDNYVEEEFTTQEPGIIPINEEYTDFDEIAGIDDIDLNEADVVVDISDDLDKDIGSEIEDEIIQDVDKVFTTRKEDDFSDSDLDFIDEINSNEEIITNESEYEEQKINEEAQDDIIPQEPIQDIQSEENDSSEILETKNNETPVVPVYEANIPPEDMVMSDPIQQGDVVTHVKYGTGVVEKMIKYGNKTLFSINFDNVGRRLLDPMLTEIKKL